MRINKWLGVIEILLALGAPVSAQVIPVLQVGRSFTASTFGIDSFATPPDTDGAAGPDHFVEFINGQFAVYHKSDGAKVRAMTDAEFWSQAGIRVPNGWEVTDPRIIYDTTTQRWFAAQVDFDPSGSVNTNVFLLAVSVGPDPTGAWQATAIPSDPGGTAFADFPTLGIGAQAVYLAGDMFNVSGASVGPTLVFIPKSSLLAPSLNDVGPTWFGVMSYSTRGHILQPSICLDGSPGGNVLGLGGLGVNDLTGRLETENKVLAWRVLSGAATSLAALSASDVLTVPTFTAPLDPTQPDSSQNLDDGDARMGAAVYQVGGVLYAVHGTEQNSRAAIRWYRIRAADDVLLESGTIADPALDLFYPSIAANAQGAVVIGCNGSSITSYVSCYATLGQTVNDRTTFGSLALLKSGAASYHAPGATRTSRWGDYSATSVDPVDSSRFWTIQAYPSTRSAWATQITEIISTPLSPELAILRENGNVRLSWPATAASFQLQSTSDLNPGHVWSPVQEQPSTNGNTFSILVPASAAQQYFRLQQSPGFLLTQFRP